MSDWHKDGWCERTLISNPFNFCLCITEKQYYKALDHLKIKREDASSYMVRPTAGATVHRFNCSGDGEPAAIICITETRKLTLRQVHALIVHEVTHLCDYVMEELGELEPSKEFKAYCMQAMCQRLFLAYDDLKKKQKRKKRK
jgi:hypothetical protein